MKCKIKGCEEEAEFYGYCKTHFEQDRLYSYGLPFSEKLKSFVEDLKTRIDKKKASMLIVDGGVGEGKTTLSVEIAEEYQKKNLDFKVQYAIGGEQFQEKLVMCFDSGYKVIIYDEAGDFNSRGALTSFNQMLNRVFDTYRAFKILVILVLPSFHVLDNPLFDKRIPRGLVHCYARTTKHGNFSVYSLYRMYYLRHKIKKYIVPAYAYSGTTPNFRGHFLDLSPKKSIELEKISIEGKKNIVNENILKNRGLVSIKEISKKVIKSIVWVRQKLKQYNVKPVKTYKKRNYYDKSVVDMLMR